MWYIWEIIQHYNMRDYILEYIEYTQSRGRYTFLLDDILEKFNISNNAAIKALNRLVKKGKVRKIRNGFYIIIPPEHYQRGTLPVSFYIDDFMKFVSKPYYISLLSAAAMNGASHQQPQEFYVNTIKPTINNIRYGGIKVNFHYISKMPESGINKIKTDTGYALVSSAELTAVDIVKFANKIGGFSRATDVIYELTESIQKRKLAEVVKNEENNSCLQRLGYILEKVLENNEFSDIVYRQIKERKLRRVLLNHAAKTDQYKITNRWKVIENIEIEPDL
jgi:predicted transcriptional regulator of viral defense system